MPCPLVRPPSSAAGVVSEPEPGLAAVPEAAVQLAWARGQFTPADLRTTDGERVEVLAPGRLNRDSGPDLSMAVVRVGDLLWSGDVEIHRTSADWVAHGHHLDPAYDRVVLHVVLSADRATGSLCRADGSRLPELVLLPHLSVSLARLVRDTPTRSDGPPCAVAAPLPSPPDGWLASLGLGRLRARARGLAERYRAHPDLDALLARRVFRALGYHANADAMETLAGRLDLGALRALGTPGAIRAHLLDASGLGPSTLFTPRTRSPMASENWRRGGRPANAPRHRIAQAARLVAPGGVLARGGLDALRAALDRPVGERVGALRRPAEGPSPRLGAARARDVVLNALLPVALLDAEQREAPGAADRVAELAMALPAPSDRTVRAYAQAGLAVRSALEALGVHALADRLCAEGRCARCAIGQRLAPALSGESG